MAAAHTGQPLELDAISFDFGNTLVHVGREALAAVVRDTALAVRARGLVDDERWFLTAWDEERARQFRQELPRFREVDLAARVTRILARHRGLPPPPDDGPWDDDAARRLVDPAEVEIAIDAYSQSFVDRMTPEPAALPVLERLAGVGFTLAILSNWPLAATIDRFAEAHGWLPHLRAIVVSQRVGTIKPHRAIFDHARERLGAPAERILHVGDDWAADVVGARQAGWRAAYLRDRQRDTPLPRSEPPAATDGPGGDRADLILGELSELVPLVRRGSA